MDRINQQIKLKDGRILGYAEYGDPNGIPLIYFHGWPTSRLSGIETDEAAKKLGVRVISLDRPGYGLSTYKKDRKLLDWPDDVIELADSLGINKFSVMGVSGGGPYAAVCGYKIPERINKVGIVVGLAPTYIKGNLKGMEFLNKITMLTARHLYISRFIAALVSYITYFYLPSRVLFLDFEDEPDRKLLKTKLSKEITVCAKEAFRQGLNGPMLDLKLYSSYWGFEVKGIKSKVYLWYDALDRNVSLNMGKYYKQEIPNSELMIYNKGGHLARHRLRKEEEIVRTLTTI